MSYENIKTVFDLAAAFGSLRRSSEKRPDLHPDVEAELKALVTRNCEVLREYRREDDGRLMDYCRGTGVSIETLYRIEGGDLAGVPLDDIEAVLDTYASGYCS